MSASPNLQLPYLDANQNQKSVTHNEALRTLDALVGLAVLSSALAAPPAAPPDGVRFIVAAGGAGAWAGKDGDVAAWQDGAWSFFPPAPGRIAFDLGAMAPLVWTGTAWVPLFGLVGQLGAKALGIGTAPDAANPLSATLNAALFSGLGPAAGGTGDVRVKLNKAAPGATASLLFQDAFSGRAEIGLAGDDDLHVRVSADGSRFLDAMVVAGASGTVSFLAAPTAPTAASGDSTAKLATTAFVAAAVGAGGGSGGGAVSSVAGRTGAIVLAVADVAGAAPLASPGFAGSVGIGGAAPAGVALDVRGPGGITFGDSADAGSAVIRNDGGFHFAADGCKGAPGFFMSAPLGYFFRGTYNGPEYHFLSTQGGVSYLNNGGGALGIGTTSPGSTLDVLGSFHASGVAKVGGALFVGGAGSGGFGAPWNDGADIGIGGTASSGGNSGRLALRYDTGAEVAYIGAVSPGAAWRSILFQAASYDFRSNGSTQGLFQDEQGRVGIGTQAPTAPLDVAGGIHASGAISNAGSGSGTTSDWFTSSAPLTAGATGRLAGYYQGLGVKGASTGGGTPIFGVLNSQQAGGGVGSAAFTVYDTNAVVTFNNVLDDGAGNATVAGSLLPAADNSRPLGTDAARWSRVRALQVAAELVTFMPSAAALATTQQGAVYADSTLTALRWYTGTQWARVTNFAKFAAYPGSDCYVAAATWTKVNFNNADANDQGVFTASSSRFTAPEAGTYKVGASLAYRQNNSSAPSALQLAFYKNGAACGRGRAGATGLVSGVSSVGSSVVLKLAAGDTVEAWAFFTGADGYVAAADSCFWGVQLP